MNPKTTGILIAMLSVGLANVYNKSFVPAAQKRVGSKIMAHKNNEKQQKLTLLCCDFYIHSISAISSKATTISSVSSSE